MNLDSTQRLILAPVIFPALLGFVLGSALQLQQAQLWPWPVYVGLILLALLMWVLAALKSVALVARTAVARPGHAVASAPLSGLVCHAFCQPFGARRLRYRG